MSESKPKNDPTILVGIDFGTTGTGVTYRPSWAKDTDLSKVITTWDDSNGDVEKVDSAVVFRKSSSQSSKWGISASLDESPILWFKLMLIDEKDLPDEVRDSEKVRTCRRQLQKLNKTAVEVISFYLRNLWNHCHDLFTKDLTKAMVNVSRFSICMTVPAIWPEYARRRMREAADKAGLIQHRLGGQTQLSFVSEPEAAALATLADIGARPDLSPGVSFTVVDCGGGTVDVISYSIVAVAPDMVIRECVQGQGGLCGAMFVDSAFAHLLKKKFGETTFSRISSSDLQEILQRDWTDGIRHQFKGQKKSWTIRQPFDSMSDKVKRGGGGQPKITITSDDVREVFAPTMKKIQQLVLGQVDAVRQKTGQDPKFIVLVGGFGRNLWLQQYLRDGSRSIEVLQSSGAGPWTAICRGAVLHALKLEKIDGHLNVQIQSRISRMNIGIEYSAAWDPAVHDLRDKYWCGRQECWTAGNQVKWFILAGDDVSDKAPVSHSYCRLLDTTTAPEVIKTKIFLSRSVPPAARMDASVSVFCTIVWHTKIDVASLPPFAAPSGKIWSKLHFDVVMTCTGGNGVDVEIIHDGKKMASHNVDLEFEDHGDIFNGR